MSKARPNEIRRPSRRARIVPFEDFLRAEYERQIHQEERFLEAWKAHIEEMRKYFFIRFGRKAR